MNINWYPGHMLKTRKQIIDDLKLIDIVIEILDARIPISSKNPDIQKIIQNKKRIVILNKSDLAEEKETTKWVEYYKKNGIKNLTIKAYPEDRHELFNEDNKEEVEKDLINWIEKIL